jgi:NAD(P)-dependent dehydrogenase (short-subunit alcohol dehydrogenase family)
MDLQLTGKRALVVGGTKGLGRAVAVALASEGAVVVVASRTHPEAAAAAIAAETGGLVFGFVVDTRDDDSVQALVARAVEEVGGIDILVNTAAVPWLAEYNVKPSLTSDDAVREHIETKVLGYLRTARAVAPQMIASGWGRIINVSGLAARSTGAVAQTIRNVSVAALTKNLADELGPHGINVTVVHPGLTRTDALAARLTARAESESTSVAALEAGLVHNTIGHLVDAEDVAAVITFLASPRSVAITGDAIAAGGGVPGPIYY